jgi:hypothetical protein
MPGIGCARPRRNSLNVKIRLLETYANDADTAHGDLVVGHDVSLANRFKLAMSDAFEQFVGGILHRIFDKSPHLRVIVGEDEMQAAWTEKKGQKPSVCDWMLFGEGHCIVIDATNHAVKREAAQGLATWEEYGIVKFLSLCGAARIGRWRLRRGTRATGIRSRSSGMRCGCITVSR